MSNSPVENTILGFGDPLLDLSVEVEPEFLAKFGLRANDGILSGARQADLTGEICDRYTPRYTAGGSVQNTLRVLQWILRQPRISVMFGAIGNDRFGRHLEQSARECGVDVHYHIVENQGTGTCCVLLSDHGQNRSLVTTKGASAHYSLDHLDRKWDLVERAKFFYASCFFLSSNFRAVLKVALHSRAKGKVFCLNLSAPFLTNVCKDNLATILPFVDIIFGNSDELDAFVAGHKSELHMKEWEIATLEDKLRAMSKYLRSSNPRLVVITNGSGPVTVARGDDISFIPIEKIDPERVVDTNGAGDAFVGGFLAFLIKGCPIETCVKNGCVAALSVIQENGCSTPDRSKVRFFSNKTATETPIASITCRQISIQ